MSAILGLIIIFAIVRAIIGIGIGVITYGAVIWAIQNAIQQLKSAYNSMPFEILNFLAIAGMDDFLGIICGALLARASIQFARRLALLGS